MRMRTHTGMLSHVQLVATLWNIAYQAPLSLGFSRQEYWSGFLFPTPGDLPNSEIEAELYLLRWHVDSLPLCHLRSPRSPRMCRVIFFKNNFIYLSTYGCAGSSWLRRLSLVVASRGYSLVAVWQASHCMAPPVESVGSRAHQLQYLLYMGSVVMAPGL